MQIHTQIKEHGIVNFTKTQMFMLSQKVGKWLTCEVKKPTRSNQQNKLYWVFLGVIEKETGNLAKYLHEHFKEKLLPDKFETITLNKEVIEIKIPASTTKLKKLEFSEYIMKIEAKVGIQCPDPHDVGIMCGKAECPRCNEGTGTEIEYPTEDLGEIKGF